MASYQALAAADKQASFQAWTLDVQQKIPTRLPDEPRLAMETVLVVSPVLLHIDVES